MDISQEQIHRNLDQVLERIRRAAEKSHRSRDDIRLVVVTKSHSVQVARAAIDAGAKILGENYAEEGLSKIQEIGTIPGVEWHMIGHVQSRKAVDVAGKFTLIHSLDSVKLAERINRVAEAKGWSQSVLIQVNVSGEESKSGFPCWNDDQMAALIVEIEKIASMSSVKINGLMTIPPFSEDGEFARPFFKRLRGIRDQLTDKVPGSNFSELSMGMSADFEIAVEEGATLVRVGTAILGERTYTKG
jgi:pyridoxal phosphate enzyme (YggS family)